LDIVCHHLALGAGGSSSREGELRGFSQDGVLGLHKIREGKKGESLVRARKNIKVHVFKMKQDPMKLVVSKGLCIDQNNHY
jgi:hypothetical protein